MGPDDTFQVIRFGDTADKLFAEPRARDRGECRGTPWRYVDSLDANEGTMLIDGLHASLAVPARRKPAAVVTFLTDGFIGNEDEGLAKVHRVSARAGCSASASGRSPTDTCWTGMASIGRGAAAFLGLNDDAEDVMAAYFERISHPAMTDLALDFGGAAVTDVYPRHLPDLYVGRPVIVTGRFSGEMPAEIRVTGNVGGERRQVVVRPGKSDDHPALAYLWARTKVADLTDESAYQPNADLPAEIKTVALEYGLVSPHTSFLAVDASTPTAGDHGTTVAVPVPVPAGVKYDTTVRE